MTSNLLERPISGIGVIDSIIKIRKALADRH